MRLPRGMKRVERTDGKMGRRVGAQMERKDMDSRAGGQAHTWTDGQMGRAADIFWLPASTNWGTIAADKHYL